MKKIYFLLLSGVLMTASCSKDGYQELYSTYPASAISIITNTDNGEVTVTPGIYGFKVSTVNYDSKVSVISPNLISDNTSLDFTTEESAYKSTGFDIYVEDAVGLSKSGLSLENANFLALNPQTSPTSYGYYYDLTYIGSEYTFTVDNQVPRILIADYQIGNKYKINTFPATTFFKGTTNTTYPTNPTGFTTDEIIYRFTISQDSETKEYSADMILYNAKFASEMPMTLVAILVEDLDVEFTAHGVTITGSNITPYWYTNSNYTPLPNFEFKSVKFQTTNNNYTQGVLDYEVGEDYQGHFEGSYANTYYQP